jgi:N-acetylneuraminate synthase
MAEITNLVQAIRNLDNAKKNSIDKQDNTPFAHLKSIFEKSLAVNKDLETGHVLTFEDLEAKKPKGYGIDAAQFEKVIGTSLSQKRNAWEFLNWEDLSS